MRGVTTREAISYLRFCMAGGLTETAGGLTETGMLDIQAGVCTANPSRFLVARCEPRPDLSHVAESSLKWETTTKNDSGVVVELLIVFSRKSGPSYQDHVVTSGEVYSRVAGWGIGDR